MLLYTMYVDLHDKTVGRLICKLPAAQTVKLLDLLWSLRLGSVANQKP